MIQPITQNILYRTTDKIESNTLLNRGILDIFGYAVPTALNANNEYEARERITGSLTYFAIAFLSPLVMMPLFNRHFLKKAGIIENFKDKGVEIVRLSKKYLIDDEKTMREGIKDLIYDLKDNPNTSEKTRKKFKNVDKDFHAILDRFKGKEDLLRESLLRAHTKIAMSDYLSTSTMFIASCFGVKELTKRFTGRTGFSAEYKMADEDYTKKKSEKHEKNKTAKIIASSVIAIAGSVLINKFVQKSFLNKNAKGLMKRIRENAEKFNYTDGKFMKILPYFLITIVGDLAPFLMSARDKYELRDAAVRQAFCMAVFFGGDAVLNGLFGRMFDKLFRTNLINKENLGEKPNFWKKATAPIYTLEQLSKTKGWDKNLLKRTQKFAIGMYWLNLALITLILGIGLPKALNYVLRKSVNKDLSQKEPQTKFESIEDFLK